MIERWCTLQQCAARDRQTASARRLIHHVGGRTYRLLRRESSSRKTTTVLTARLVKV